MPIFINNEPLILTRFEGHESLHPELKHLSITSVIRSFDSEDPNTKFSTPMPANQSSAYPDLGQIFEMALDTEFKRRAGLREKAKNPKLRLQHKICEPEAGLHLIPDAYLPKKLGMEFKLTFRPETKRPEDLLDDKPEWKLQTQCYAHILKIYQWQFFVCWCRNTKPNPQIYTFEYTPDECSNTWELIKKQATILRANNSV